MSQSVPQIYSQVKEFIYASLKFSESLHRRWADSTTPMNLHQQTFNIFQSHSIQHASSCSQQNENTDGNSALDAELLLSTKQPNRRHLRAELVIQSCHSSLVSISLWSCYCDITVFMGSLHLWVWTVFKSTTLPSTSSHPFWQYLFSLSSVAFGWLLWGVCVVLVTGTPNSFPEG